MLNKVRLRLMLNNLLVFIVFFTLLFGGIFGLMRHNFVRQAERMLERNTFDDRPPLIREQRFIRFDYPFGRSAQFVYSEDGTVLFANIPEDGGVGKYENIANAIRFEARDRGIYIDENNQRYRFLKTEYDSGNRLVAFMDAEMEEAVTQSLLSTFLVVGFAGILFIAVSSWFLTKNALVPIKQAWDRQNRFVADASHELRTPLTAIVTNLDVLSANPDETIASQQKWLTGIRRAYTRMGTLVDDLLFLARSDAGELTDPVTTFPLLPIVTETVEGFESRFLQKNLTHTITVSSEMALTASEQRIRQLLSVLLDNAVKYTPPGGTVQVDAKQDGNRMEIRVSDTGIGIAQEHHSKVFERFFRADPSRSREVGGNGMGLAIATQIVTQHGGELLLESELGRGACFIIRLPLPGSRRKNRKQVL